MTPEHLKLFNPSRSPDASASFILFSSLPIEIRMKIWESTLLHWRFLHLRLKTIPAASEEEEDADDGIDNNNNEQPASGVGIDYILWTEDRQPLSKLLSVNRESRRAALGFYRVHIPCEYHWGDEKLQKHSTMYINPEWDVLHIQLANSGMSFTNFALDMKIYDPLDIGLLNVAFHHNSIQALYEIKPHELDGRERRKAFRSALTSVRQVFFCNFEPNGRILNLRVEWRPMFKDCEIHRPLPIISGIPAFDRLPQDPRPISNDLRRLCVGICDPRHMPFGWLKLLKRWHVAAERCEYRFLLSHMTQGKEMDVLLYPESSIVDRNSARRWLMKNEQYWVSTLERYAPSSYEGAHDLTGAAEPVIGFWSFPMEAMGPLPDLSEDHPIGAQFWRLMRLLNLENVKPELWVSHIL